MYGFLRDFSLKRQGKVRDKPGIKLQILDLLHKLYAKGQIPKKKKKKKKKKSLYFF